MNDLGRRRADSLLVDEAIARVVASGWYVQGPEHEAFETEFAAYCGVPHCIGVASGTDGLEIAIRALTADRAGAVLTAANAGGYTSVAARCAGREVRYADIDAQTLCLDPTDVARKLDGISVVVVTHLYGRLAPIEEIVALCRQADVSVLEDCAQAVGAQRDGRRAGSFGDLAAFSYYPTKNLGAMGDGGAIVASGEELAGQVRMLRQYGWSSKYVIEREGGRNSRLDEIHAAVLRVRMRSLDADNKRRREIVARYVEAARATAVTVMPTPDADHVAHLAVALAEDRDSARAQLARAGVQTDVHYPVPDHLQAVYRTDAQPPLPVTEGVSRRLFTLPCFPSLLDAEIDAVCSALEELR